MSHPDHERQLIDRVIQRDTDALAELFSQHRDRLWRMVNFRMDPRLHGRIDADDVLQEAWLSVTQRIDHFLADASRSIFVWFRLITSQTLVDIHRRHLGTQKRNAALEVSIYRGPMPEASSAALAAHLMGSMTSPSNAAVRAETKLKIQDALNRMGELDREVLTLRHFELLSNSETAGVLGISQQAASNRYIKALKRMKTLMTLIQEGQD